MGKAVCPAGRASSSAAPPPCPPTARAGGGAKPVALDDPRAARPPVPGEAHAENAESLQEVASLPAGGGAEQAPPPSDSPPVDLPPVESLNKESDFKAFLADGVPEELKRAALRKLWLSDPAFAFRDGLDDYDENFRIVDKMLATADELRKGWAGTEEQAEPTESAESAEPGKRRTRTTPATRKLPPPRATRKLPPPRATRKRPTARRSPAAPRKSGNDCGRVAGRVRQPVADHVVNDT